MRQGVDTETASRILAEEVRHKSVRDQRAVAAYDEMATKSWSSGMRHWHAQRRPHNTSAEQPWQTCDDTKDSSYEFPIEGAPFA